MLWKGLKPAKKNAIRNLLGYFSLFIFGAGGRVGGGNLVLKMVYTACQRYTAQKISAIRYLFRFFALYLDTLVIMGHTERPCYTGFCGLSVRDIAALQCLV